MNTNIYAVKREKGSNTPLEVFFYEGKYNTREEFDLINNRGWDIHTVYAGWKTSKLEGIGPTENEVFSEKKGHGDGVIITGKRMQERHIDLEIRQDAGNNVTQRRTAIGFHDPNYVYDLCFTWMGQTRWLCDCEIEGFKIETGKVNKKQELTVSYLCAESYYTINNEFPLPEEASGIREKSIATVFDPDGDYEDTEIRPTFSVQVLEDCTRPSFVFTFMGVTAEVVVKPQEVRNRDILKVEPSEGQADYFDLYDLNIYRDGEIIETYGALFSFSKVSGDGVIKSGQTKFFSCRAPKIDVDNMHIELSSDVQGKNLFVQELTAGVERKITYNNEQNNAFRGPLTIDITGAMEMVPTKDTMYALPFMVRFGDDLNDTYEYYCLEDVSLIPGCQIVIYHYTGDSRAGCIKTLSNEYDLYAFNAYPPFPSGNVFEKHARDIVTTYPTETNAITISSDTDIIHNLDMTVITGPGNIRGI